MLEAGYIDFFKYLIFGTLYVAQDPLQVLLQKKKKKSQMKTNTSLASTRKRL